MTKVDLNELVTVTQAAEMRGTSRQAINHLIKQGKLEAIDVAGKRFLKRTDVETFTPDIGGRPPKPKETNGTFRTATKTRATGKTGAKKGKKS